MPASRIILGSQSPRRLEILSDAGYRVEVISPKVNERFPYELDVYKVAEYISKLKMHDIFGFLGEDDDFIVTADTVVILERKPLGKPRTPEQAFKMLKMLNAKEHDVVTGVTLRKQGRQLSFSDTTKVYFKELSDEQILHFIENHEVLDKAGSYAIQEYIGVERFEGCYQNVMGLPMPKLQQVINSW
jgi:septum formation protein